MSGLFNKASLVLVPSGYKSGKVYSEVPTSGDGDLTFTRASDATRVNSDGLIETPRTNLVLYSEEFDNAYWKKASVSVTSNNTTAPDGATTADLIIESSSSSTHAISRSSLGLGSGTYTCSIYAKAKERSRFFLFGGGATLGGYGFDLINGTANAVTGVTAPSSFSIQSVGNGWYRCSITVTSTTFNFFEAYLLSSFSGFSYQGDGVSGLYFWGAQLETGDIATDYIPTTNSARTTFAGITQDGTSASNVPRLDYSQGSCPALLLEPQRTNLVLYSEQFDNAYWSKTNATITTNATTAPDGTLTADLFTKISALNTISQVSSPLTVYTTTGANTLSVYIKPNVGNSVLLRLDNAGNTANFGFDFTTKTFSTGGANVISSSFDELPNGWFRLKVTGNVTSTSWSLTPCLLFDNPTNDSMYIWGAQLE